MKAHFFRDIHFAAAFLVLAGGCGVVSFVFLAGLEAVTAWRIAHPALFLLAPVGGLVSGIAYVKANKATDGLVSRGNALIVARLRGARGLVPPLMAPLILGTTWLAHLVGASVGREGTAVQMAGSLASLVSRLFRMDQEQAWTLLLFAVAAGFGSVFGVPITGAVFAFEVAGMLRRERGRAIGSLDHVFLIGGSLAASELAHAIAMWLGTHHAAYPAFDPRPFLSFFAAAVTLMAAIASGLLAWGFIAVTGIVRNAFFRVVRVEGLRPVVSGMVVALGFFFSPLHRYAGLGADVIVESFARIQSFADPFVKLLATALAIGSGFRGGEVTPLFFMGATLGSAMSGLFTSEPAGLAGLGMVAVFGAAAGTPIAMAVMAGELFGWSVLPIALPFCLIASAVCRSARLYDEI
jgi:H+/Cl- antiporter ClcA